MFFLIPTGDGVTAHFDQQVTLEDVTYTFEFRWNVRVESWFMSIFDAEGTTPIILGTRLVSDWPLFSGTVRRGPPGVFFVLDTSGRGEEPDFDGLGSRFQLFYLTSDDLEAEAA